MKVRKRLCREKLIGIAHVIIDEEVDLWREKYRREIEDKKEEKWFYNKRKMRAEEKRGR